MTGAAARAERAATADGEERQIERYVLFFPPRLLTPDTLYTASHVLTPDRSLFSERVVTIVVGPSEVTWRIHENLLSGASDFFKSAFNSGFKEALEDRLALPEDDPQAFELFVRWLYARAMAPLGPSSSASASASASVSVSASTSTSSSPAGANNSTSSALLLSLLGGSGSAGGVGIQIRTCLRLYVLAHKLLVEELENACADAAGLYYRAGTRRPDVRDAQYVYERTPRGAGGLRRLLAERLALGLFRGKSQQSQPQHADAAAAAEWRDVLNETPDLGFDIISEIAGYRWVSGGNAPARTVSAPCAFHRHESGEQCR